MSRPIIGITTDSAPGRDGTPHQRQFVRVEYIQRVREAGGVPILLPVGTIAEEAAALIDGWLIPGGDDLDPSLWGEEVHPQAGLCDVERTKLEQSLYEALPPETPILGICYGCQLINVLQGGSLFQHIPDQLGHDQHRGDSWQEFAVEPDSQLAQILGPVEAAGRSWHHQAIHRLGRDLRISARHEDGTVEGVESTVRPWTIGVQWHPERSDSEATPLIFASFIGAAKRHREAKRQAAAS